MFDNTSITKRIAMGITIPLLGLAILGSIATWEAYRNYKSMVFLGYVSETINELAVLAHLLQEERGQTAIFIGSGTRSPHQALIQARKDSINEKKIFMRFCCTSKKLTMWKWQES